MTVETTELRPGHRISRVLKGGWQLAGDHGEVRREVAIADMEAFLDAGITTFDCADIYKGVEEMIGEFIADVRRRRGAEVADRVVVHTKLVPDLGRLADLRPDEVEAIVDRSLARLKDRAAAARAVLLVGHALGNAVEALAVLKDCQRKGKIAHLGTTNWDAPVMDRFIDAGFDIVSAQVQYSLLDRRPAGAFSDWGRRRDVQILCYGTLAGGFLTETWLGRPDPGFAFENRSLVKYRLIIDEFGPWDLFQALLDAEGRGRPARRVAGGGGDALGARPAAGRGGHRGRALRPPPAEDAGGLPLRARRRGPRRHRRGAGAGEGARRPGLRARRRPERAARADHEVQPQHQP
jgi:aryl-alcohol dehydrogenase-like predicted oxidoreductase